MGDDNKILQAKDLRRKVNNEFLEKLTDSQRQKISALESEAENLKSSNFDIHRNETKRKIAIELLEKRVDRQSQKNSFLQSQVAELEKAQEETRNKSEEKLQQIRNLSEK